MIIREATDTDFEHIWPIFHEIVSAGETYGFQQNTSMEEARKLWMELPRQTFVAVVDGIISGTYYIKTNYGGPGSHVCNCGYMVSPKARGKGLGSAMCEHSQRVALDAGYLAMQFNFVASTNETAVKLWSRLGFAIVGRLPKAFNHHSKGLVDAYVMYKWLKNNN